MTVTSASKHSPALPHLLMFAGVLPFLAGAVLLLAGVSSLPVLGLTSSAVASYGLVIVIFLTGIHWGQQLSLGKAASGLFIFSNVIAVMVWLAWLLIPQRYFLVFLVLPFTAILAVDRKLMNTGVLARAYLRSRAAITLLVIFCLLVTASLS